MTQTCTWPSTGRLRMTPRCELSALPTRRLAPASSVSDNCRCSPSSSGRRVCSSKASVCASRFCRSMRAASIRLSAGIDAPLSASRRSAASVSFSASATAMPAQPGAASLRPYCSQSQALAFAVWPVEIAHERTSSLTAAARFFSSGAGVAAKSRRIRSRTTASAVSEGARLSARRAMVSRKARSSRAVPPAAVLRATTQAWWRTRPDSPARPACSSVSA